MILQRTGDSKWYVNYTDIGDSPESSAHLIKEMLGLEVISYAILERQYSV